MSTAIELIKTDNGLAVIGAPTEVERFLHDQELEAFPNQTMRLGALRSRLGDGAALAQAGADVMAESGRWVKLTAESAQKVKQFGLMPSKTPGVSHAMIGAPGHIRGWLQLESGVDPVTELTHGGHSFQDP